MPARIAGTARVSILLAAALFATNPVHAEDRDDGGERHSRMSCADLVHLNLPDTTVQSATEVPAGPFPSSFSPGAPSCSSDITSPQLPAYCRVIASVNTPGAAAPIGMEVWLPLDGWNGKFEGIGNHGFAGEIEYGDMGPELVKGYAVAATDTGHVGTGTAWMQNHQSIVNYGSLGVHEMAVKSKALIRAFYGRSPRYSYFNGCSTGGKEGLMAAQRYPSDFDGINVAGSANFAQIHNRIQYVWNGHVTFGNANTPLPASVTALLNAGALAQCDAADGIVDGVIDDPMTCTFDPSSLLCKPGQAAGTCLTPAQVTAAQLVYQGPRNPRTGQEIYPGYGRGTERGWGSNTTGPGVSTADTFFKFMVYNDPNWDFRTFDFDSQVTSTDQKFSPLIDAIDPDLRAFRKAGGKLLFSHAWSSTTHPAARSIEYYEQVVSVMNGGKRHLENEDFEETGEFFRLFMAPGGTGSKGPQTYDSMPYLERWVEHHEAPRSIIANHKTAGVIDRTRPLCPYPQTAVYLGAGSTDDAQNFRCEKPRKVVNYYVKDGPEMDDPHPVR